MRRRIHRTSNGQIFGRVVMVILAIMLAGIVYAVWSIYQQLSGRVRAAQSVERVTDNVWQLTYEGDFYFQDFLNQGGAVSDSAVGEFLAPYMGKKARHIGHQDLSIQTTGFPAALSDSPFLGVNTGASAASVMLVAVQPDSAYASISTVGLDYLNLDRNYDPTRGLLDKMLVLTALYFPSDGLNDRGLAVTDLPQTEPVVDINTPKPDLTTFTAIRLLLDRCSNVPEAMMLLRRFDVHPSGHVMHQLLLADSDGRCMLISWNPDGSLQSEPQSPERVYSLSALRDVISGHSNTNTQWSVRYDLRSLTATWYFRHDFTRHYSLMVPSR